MQTVEIKSFSDVDLSDIKLSVIAVFEKPVDYPDKYVARLFDGEKATSIALLGTSVEKLRADIRLNYINMMPFPRGKKDVRALVECWM